jgi:hypothetical protein
MAKEIRMIKVQAIAPGIDHTGMLRGPGMKSTAGEALDVFEMPETLVVGSKGVCASWLKPLDKLSGVRAEAKPQRYSGTGSTIEALHATVAAQGKQIADLMALVAASVKPAEPVPAK